MCIRDEGGEDLLSIIDIYTSLVRLKERGLNALNHHHSALMLYVYLYRCQKGELFDYLTEVVTMSEKRTR